MTPDSKGQAGPQEVFHRTELAVIGGGIAGISAALEAHKLGVATTLITDGPLGRSNSIMAQGGIQAPHDDAADVELMIEDALAVASGEAEERRVRSFVTELPQLLVELEQRGLEFDRDVNGQLLRRSAGGLSSPRIATVGDQIGRPLMRLLREQISRSADVLTHTRVTAVRADGQLACVTNDGLITSRALIVATGGVAYQSALDSGELTSNPPNQNARLRQSLDELGLDATIPLRFQWHPFGVIASRKGITLSCLPESIAALGPRLVTGSGESVQSLPAPRGEVVEAMKSARARGLSLHLTLGDMDDAERGRFPKVTRLMNEYGPIPEVTPVLHYELSGYRTGLDQSTSVPGLFLAGEIVGGIHGKERLMGTGVADSLVHGRRAGQSAAHFLRGG